MLAADPDIEPDVPQRPSALSGDGAVLPPFTRRPIKLCSTEESARPERQLKESKRSREPSERAASANSEDQETADAERNTLTPVATTTVSSVLDGDGVVPLPSTRKLNKRSSTEEDAERLLREVLKEDDMSSQSSREWLSDSKRVENTLPNMSFTP